MPYQLSTRSKEFIMDIRDLLIATGILYENDGLYCTMVEDYDLSELVDDLQALVDAKVEMVIEDAFMFKHGEMGLL